MTGDIVTRTKWKQSHIAAVDDSLAVCGMDLTGTMLASDQNKKKGVCSRCRSGPDYSRRRGAGQAVTEEYLARLRALSTSRLPTDPQERMAHMRFLSKVEMVRKAFDGEILV